MEITEDTDLVIERCERSVSVKWKIRNWQNYYNKLGERVLSPGFTSFGCREQWFIACWPYGNKNENYGHVSCALFTRNKIDYTYTISEYWGDNCSGNIVIEEDQFIGIPRLCNYYDSRTYSYNELTCKITIIIEEDARKTGSALLKAISQIKYQVCKDLEGLLLDKSDSDVEIMGRNVRIPAHKYILSSRSPVFKAMFSSGMKEAHENSVKIEDLDDEVLDDMVKYIYSGTSPNLEKLCAKLLVAADMYDLPGLKDLCELQLIENITIDNFCSTFSFSDQNKLEKLKSACLSWGCNKMDEIAKTTDFKEVMFSKPELMMYIIQYLSSSLHVDEWADLNLKLLLK